MNWYAPKWLWMILLLLTMAAGNAHTQWRMVTPGLTQVTNSQGTMCYQDGIVWIATTSLFMSTDSGNTWTTQSLPFVSDNSFDIEFNSPTEGVFTGVDGSWVTSDAGTTWQEVANTGGSGACFLNTDQEIAVVGESNQLGKVTQDGGVTWNDMPYQDYGFCVRYKSGTIYEFGGDQDGAFIFSSSDLGMTWQQGNAGIDWDSFSFSVDSCDPNRIYLSHEDAIAPTDQFSKIFLTTDRGDTWQTMMEQPEPFFCGSVAEGYSAIYCPSVAQGVFRSTDRGMTWSSISGPSVWYDTRLIAAINDNILLAVDSFGNVWRTDNSGGDSITAAQSSPDAALLIPSRSSILNQSICSTPVDTFLSIAVVGCGAVMGTLDSLWLTGSSSFMITDTRTAPRTIAASDSIFVRYAGTKGPDTTILHLQYDLGSGVRDTTIQLIGTVTSSLASQPTQIHRESASAYFGQIDSLTLGVDVSSQINLDSLWPYITTIQAIYSWDSSIVSYDGYFPPPGWSLTSLASHGNAVDISIQNNASSPTQPLDLGTAFFRPATTQLVTTWIELPSLFLDVGGKALSLCVTDNEDNHWAVKTLGVQSGVAEVPTPNSDISIYPNPAGDEVFVQNTNEFSASITMYDEIGREIANANAAPSSTSSISMESLPSGAYFLVCRIAGRTETKCITKE